MTELKEKVQALIDKYDPELSSKGIKILLAKRYFESEVYVRSGGHGAGALLNSIARAKDLKKEKELYKFERNKYHCLILTICPIEAKGFRREDCREYAFILKKIERAHLGQEPHKIAYHEDKILSKVEKRIQKILKKAEKSSATKTCQNNIIDALRYSTCTVYGYKEKFLGKDRFFWDIVFCIAAVVLVFLIVFICWIIFK